MSGVKFDDDMKEFKTFSYILLAVSLLVCGGFVANVCVYGITPDNIKTIIILGILTGFLLCSSVYFAFYIAIYQVIYSDNTLTVKSLFGKKSVALTNEISFERKKYNSKYDIFKITVGKNKITVRTKKSNELVEILQQHLLINDKTAEI